MLTPIAGHHLNNQQEPSSRRSRSLTKPGAIEDPRKADTISTIMVNQIGIRCLRHHKAANAPITKPP
jgi:hypothetical protein